MKKIGLWLASLLWVVNLSAQNRSNTLLEKDWRFTRQDDASFSNKKLNDSKWQKVRIPHDWAIYGPFDIENDIQRTAIKQDGQEAPIAHAGRTGGLPFVGVGWYRRAFDLPSFNDNQKVYIQFDGAMSHAQVFVNGKKVGIWPYGYNTFYFDVTPFVHKGKNELAVRLENKTQQSRWYPGAGLYRNVHLITTNKIHIPIWGVQITTPVIKKDFAKVEIKTQVDKGGQKSGTFWVQTEIVNPQGQVVKTERKELDKYAVDNTIQQDIYVDRPELWDTEHPNLYKAITKLYHNQNLEDEYTTTFGIRSIEIKPNDGLCLNGKKIMIQGACMHHDLGPLGGAVNEAAIRRQIRMLKDMGVNAIRTSHNMPAPEYVKLANEMGMMLAVETFDEWGIPKVENGYHLEFKDWAKKDLENVVKHYRNDPSVIMWFIGNEVEEQSNPQGAKVARQLQDIIHHLDKTRPVSNGMDRPDHVLKNNMAATLDVAGFNYRPHKYQEEYKTLPQQIILGSETASTISSRGVYKFPVERQSMPKYKDQQISSYDLSHCSWSNLPEDDWIVQEDLPYTIGEFIWTGFDYLGEPTPYYSEWPSHSSYFGAIDLAGIPKDRFYLYRSHWNKDKETLHILPHWNWKGREGQITPVFVYTNYPTAELFINGKSQGKRTKQNVDLDASGTDEAKKNLERQKRYRLMWMDTKYEPGTLKVVAYDKDGKAVAEKEIHTAGKLDHFRMTVENPSIKADGKDLSFVTIEVVDKDGNLVPDYNELANFKVSGAGTYRAGANGDPTCVDQFHLPKMHFFNGKLVAIVQAKEVAGKATLQVKAKGVKTGKASIEVK
ncbi:DUF4982 domain-containing protein [Ornithobacterium rhinotracheale]|uniref:DUF4982 domain-containing protein n=1 Tax=Ornithobacterium rhinotracheale TaxID=28251 RepID=UPI003FA4796A